MLLHAQLLIYLQKYLIEDDHNPTCGEFLLQPESEDYDFFDNDYCMHSMLNIKEDHYHDNTKEEKY